MGFSTRNMYYLRISSTTVLPLYLYLDEKHTDWMSDRVLQHVLADLRLRIPEKLRSEADAQLGPGGPANSKKGTIDVHRGDTYQFGYFLRKTDAHVVVIKTRRFVAAPPPQLRAQSKPNPPPTKSSASEKRKRAAPKKKDSTSKKVNKKQKTKGKGRARDSDDDEDIIDISSDDDESEEALGTLTPAPAAPLRRSSRRTAVATGGYQDDSDEDHQPAAVDSDVEMANANRNNILEPENPMGDSVLDDTDLIAMDADDEPTPAVKAEEAEIKLTSQDRTAADEQEAAIDAETTNDVVGIPLLQDTEDEKPKPILKLKYQGFNIHGKCICVIVEPYPPIQSTPRSMSLAPTGIVAPRAPSIAPADYVSPSAAQHRARTPLFLPEYDRDRSETPAPWTHEERILPPVPLFNEPVDEDQQDMADGGMFELSQILQSMGGYPAGAADDEDEIDGAVFFGDADEVRGL